MGKKVLILSGSPRKGGNSDTLCDRFMGGASQAGNECEKVFIRDERIAPCLGCYFCENSGGECAQKDNMAALLQKMIDCDVLVLASPVYFYAIDAQIKAVIDRTVARYTEIANKELYFILTAAESGESAFAVSIECFRSFARCLPGSREKGVICGGGAWKKGEITDKPAMDEAYEMGKKV